MCHCTVNYGARCTYPTMKSVKSDWKTILSTLHLQSLMFLSVEGFPLEKFYAKAAVYGSGPPGKESVGQGSTPGSLGGE